MEGNRKSSFGAQVQEGTGDLSGWRLEGAGWGTKSKRLQEMEFEAEKSHRLLEAIHSAVCWAGQLANTSMKASMSLERWYRARSQITRGSFDKLRSLDFTP